MTVVCHCITGKIISNNLALMMALFNNKHKLMYKLRSSVNTIVVEVAVIKVNTQFQPINDHKTNTLLF